MHLQVEATKTWTFYLFIWIFEYVRPPITNLHQSCNHPPTTHAEITLTCMETPQRADAGRRTRARWRLVCDPTQDLFLCLYCVVSISYFLSLSNIYSLGVGECTRRGKRERERVTHRESSESVIGLIRQARRRVKPRRR